MKLHASWETFDAENDMNARLQVILDDGWEPFAASGGGTLSDHFIWFRKAQDE